MAAKRVNGPTIDMREMFLLHTAMRRNTLTIWPLLLRDFAGWQSQEQVLILDDISWPRVQQLVRMHNQHRLAWGVNPSSCRKDILRQVKTSLLLFILDFSRGCNPKRTASYITARVAIHPHKICAGFCGALQSFGLVFDGEGVVSWIIRSAKWKLHSATWYGLHDIWGPHSETGHTILFAEPTSMSLTMQSCSTWQGFRRCRDAYFNSILYQFMRFSSWFHNVCF